MKTALIVFIVLLASSSAQGQIPNPSFDAWLGDSVLTGWSCNNSPAYKTIMPTTGRKTGSLAVEGLVINAIQGRVAPSLSAGSDGKGFAYALHPRQFTFWYKFSTPVNNPDYVMASVVLTAGAGAKTQVASATGIIRNPALSFNLFILPLTWMSTQLPDSAKISFNIGHDTSPDSPHVGSQFVVDDLAFEGATDVGDDVLLPTETKLGQNYPNPFNPTTTISFTLQRTGRVSMEVFDALGRPVATLVDAILTSGEHRITFDGTTLPSGCYLYRLRSESGSQARKMVLVR